MDNCFLLLNWYFLLSPPTISFFVLFMKVKLRAMELAKQIQNEDGVTAAVNAFHKNLPPEIPITNSTDEEPRNPIQCLVQYLEKFFCLPLEL